MSFWNKLFKDPSKPDNPDNTYLLELLDIYSKNYNDGGQNYKNVLNELLNGDSFLVFATNNDSINNSDNWTKVENNTVMKIKSAANIDGLRVIGAFTDEQTLYKWAKKPVEYTAMKSQDFLKFCQDNGFDRIIINSDQYNMYVIERNMERIKKYSINDDSKIERNSLKNPLSNTLTNKLINNFKKINTIKEVYLYEMVKGDEKSIVIGFALVVFNENSQKAALNAVQNALIGEKTEFFLDIIFLDTDNLCQMAKEIPDSLFYEK
jgi:hypothetical protein